MIQQKMRLMVRGFSQGELRFTQRVEATEADLDTILPALAASHAEAMSAARPELDMIEIEFMDETNPNERFFRVGTNPAGMVQPIRIGRASGAPR